MHTGAERKDPMFMIGKCAASDEHPMKLFRPLDKVGLTMLREMANVS